jgi:uncharacterized protein YdhG (YjbR/CyaY superfamily)
MNANPNEVDTYLAALPEAARGTLDEMRRIIKTVAPDAVESISYGLPTYKYKGRPLVYFAAWKKHCALYATSQGTRRFPLGEPLPEDLLKTLVGERLAVIEAGAPRSRRKSDASSAGGDDGA